VVNVDALCNILLCANICIWGAVFNHIETSLVVPVLLCVSVAIVIDLI